MAVTATVDTVASGVKSRRPSWADMEKHYPAKSVTTDVLYNTMIKGAFANNEKAPWLANTCATRMSYALLRSGFHLPKTKDPKASMLGDDKSWYWIRVSALTEELMLRFKGFDATLHFLPIDDKLKEDDAAIAKLALERKTKAQQFLDRELNNKNGIIVFKVKGWGDATGHFTLWNGSSQTLAFVPGHEDASKASYYPWLTIVKEDELGLVRTLIQVTDIQFWQLK